jgi:hypothetical protein
MVWCCLRLLGFKLPTHARPCEVRPNVGGNGEHQRLPVANIYIYIYIYIPVPPLKRREVSRVRVQHIASMGEGDAKEIEGGQTCVLQPPPTGIYIINGGKVSTTWRSFSERIRKGIRKNRLNFPHLRVRVNG